MCERRILIKLKGMIVIKSAMLYGIESSVVKKQHIYKRSVTEMKMLRWINKNTGKHDSKWKILFKDRGGPYW